VTIIQASCPVCGDVTLTPSDVTLTVCVLPELSSYAFVCPTCSSVVRKPACDHTVGLLTDGGVRVEVLHIPAEALEPHTGPALTADDLLDLHLQLQTL
jgi:hypothetical protein